MEIQNRRRVVLGALVKWLESDECQHALKGEMIAHVRHFVGMDDEDITRHMSREAIDRLHAASVLSAFERVQQMVSEAKQRWYSRAYLGVAEFYRREREADRRPDFVPDQGIVAMPKKPINPVKVVEIAAMKPSMPSRKGGTVRGEKKGGKK